MKDSWTQVIEALEPNYQNLKSIMETGPEIKPALYLNRNKKWRVTIQEVWPDNIEKISVNNSELDQLVEWSVEELKKWKGIRRVAWDSWDFPTKREAEKFVIIFNLSWSQ